MQADSADSADVVDGLDAVDVVVVGAGHNGLVAATLLARAGLQVLVVEADDVIGGATRTEHPFPKVPELGHSTGSYLFGLMPPELPRLLDINVPTLRRNPHYALPTEHPGAFLWFGATPGPEPTVDLLTDADRRADQALAAELAAIREDLAPAWLAEPLSLEETAAQYVRAPLREAFISAVRGSVATYLDRFGFSSQLLPAMYAVTDGLSGLNAGPDDPGTGHNFLVHNMARLPGSGGTWMIVRGGMGTVTQALADAARKAGAGILTGSPVAEVLLDGGAASGVRLSDGRAITAPVVLGCCDPFRLAALLGDAVPNDLNDRLAAIRRPGTTLKVNLAMRDLPRLACLPPDAPSPFGATIHLLPDALGEPLDAVRHMWTDVQAGRLPEFPTMEWYVHTAVDPSLQDAAGHHSAALFVQSVPYKPVGGPWPGLVDAYVERLLRICDRFAPGTSDLVADVLPLTPPDIEARFGMTGGHIHHVDNTVAFADRMPYVTGVDGVYAGSAGCHPAGSVIGAAGHNAAQRILRDLDLPENGVVTRSRR